MRVGYVSMLGGQSPAPSNALWLSQAHPFGPFPILISALFVNGLQPFPDAALEAAEGATTDASTLRLSPRHA